MFFKLGKCLNALRSCRSSTCSYSCCGKRDLLPTTSPNVTHQGRGADHSLRNNMRLIYYTFCYNEFNDPMSVIETLCSPFFDFFNQMIRVFGVGFVCLVWVLTLNMLVVYYTCIVPELYKTSTLNFVIHFTIGNWLAVNTFFHYAKGWLTNPGNPPNTQFDNVVSICKKCISPRPARAHHCSVCNKCVLKMDHHCPWFNNCIGFYNHRYFFLFCTFMTIDCLYLTTFGFHYYQRHIFPTLDLNIFTLVTANKAVMSQNATHYFVGEFFHMATNIEFIVACAAGLALFLLASFNAYIISNGSTNIEIKSIGIPCIVNKSPDHENPYDLGFKKNWMIFLGFTDFKSFFFRVILPSSHKPVGDGIQWKDYVNTANRLRPADEGAFDV